MKLEIPSFRAFNLKTKEVIYCCKKCSPPVAFISVPDSWGFYPIINGLVKIDRCLANPKDSVLSRGSGYFDSNGLEIFHFDIIKNLSTPEFSSGLEKTYLHGEVYYRNGTFYESYFNMPITNYRTLEVYGNRFETPDLLEECPPVPKEGELY